MEKIHFYTFIDKPALSYKVNGPITFTIYHAKDKEIFRSKDIIYYKWQIMEDYGRYEECYLNVKECVVPLILTTRLSRADFVRVIVEACDEDKNPHLT